MKMLNPTRTATRIASAPRRCSQENNRWLLSVTGALVESRSRLAGDCVIVAIIQIYRLYQQRPTLGVVAQVGFTKRQIGICRREHIRICRERDDCLEICRRAPIRVLREQNAPTQ